MKVGFYLRNQSVSDVDLSHPEKGNPGVGGTQFNFVALPYYLKKIYPEQIEPIIYANSVSLLPSQLTVKQASTSVEAAEHCDRDGCSIFVFRPRQIDFESNLLEALSALGCEGVAWGHNIPLPLSQMNALAECESIARLVVVGQERLDQIRDHPVFQKSIRIYNGFDPEPYHPDEHSVGDGTTVVYLGSLTPAKGFHVLAEAWPSIKREVPGAQLKVIGSARLYDEDAELGKWGVAAESYEREFRPYLSTPDGSVDESVDFLGKMGTEKIPRLQQADVGVVNPTGKTENCPGSAIEFQAAGTPVVSIAEWGLLDTVLDGKTGTLCDTKQGIRDAIVEHLSDKSKRKKYGLKGRKYIQEKFDFKGICGEWLGTFERIEKGERKKKTPITKNLFYRYKYLREALGVFRQNKFFEKLIPPLYVISDGKDIKRIIFNKLKSKTKLW
ncbi:glycosyltransferase involved in cell wall biosynthesis [Salinibacter ruber]|nr:glycosyltransferase involved in cell wall biosynthesis [Salinibacter ruber]